MAEKKKKRGITKKITKKRKSGKKKSSEKKKRIAKKPVEKKKIRAPKPTPRLPSEPIGRVTHYFPKVGATAVLVERDTIRLGDTLYFKGHTTHFKQKVESMQFEHQPILEAISGQEVGIQTKARTREHDLVFKL